MSTLINPIYSFGYLTKILSSNSYHGFIIVFAIKTLYYCCYESMHTTSCSQKCLYDMDNDTFSATLSLPLIYCVYNIDIDILSTTQLTKTI
mgnify:FL=1